MHFAGLEPDAELAVFYGEEGGEGVEVELHGEGGTGQLAGKSNAKAQFFVYSSSSWR